MARLRQSLTGVALQAIQGLGVSQPEYEEVKEILKAKYGGQRRQLQAYTGIKGFEKFSDLVCVSVVKLQAEGRDSELGAGTFHSLLVKKLTDRQVESYSWWLGEQKLDRSVLNLRDWLKEEARIRVEAAEMVHGIVDKDDGKVDGSKSRIGSKFNGRTYFGGQEVEVVMTSHLVRFVRGIMEFGLVESFKDWLLKLDGMLPRKSICASGA